MSLIIPDYEERQQIEKERMDIINLIMQIQNAKELHILATMAKRYYSKSIYDLPLALNDFVNLLDQPMLIKMQELFKEENPDLWANRQIKELLDDAIAQYTGAEDDKQKSA